MSGGAHDRLFDLRHLLAGVLGLYGAILTATGALDTAASLVKADGLPINLGLGVVLLIAAAAFALWAWLDRARPRP